MTLVYLKHRRSVSFLGFCHRKCKLATRIAWVDECVNHVGCGCCCVRVSYAFPLSLLSVAEIAATSPQNFEIPSQMMRCSVSQFFSIITIIIGISATTSGGLSCSIDTSCDHLDIDRIFSIPSNNLQNLSHFRIRIMQCDIEVCRTNIKNCNDLKKLCADAHLECRFCFYNGGMMYVILSMLNSS